MRTIPTALLVILLTASCSQQEVSVPASGGSQSAVRESSAKPESIRPESWTADIDPTRPNLYDLPLEYEIILPELPAAIMKLSEALPAEDGEDLPAEDGEDLSPEDGETLL